MQGLCLLWLNHVGVGVSCVAQAIVNEFCATVMPEFGMKTFDFADLPPLLSNSIN